MTMKVTRLLINNNHRNLEVEFSTSDRIVDTQLSFEYLRISSPASSSTKLNNGQAVVVSHKKNVTLTQIESVAKHGFRFIFDDGHSDIYSEEYIQTIAQEYQVRWQHYLTALKASGHSREALIDLKQL